jgi:hypothetical protein
MSAKAQWGGFPEWKPRPDPRDEGQVKRTIERMLYDKQPWLIWSEEHAAWWAPAEVGYSSRMDRAGRYTAERAAELVFNANAFCEVGQWNEIAIPDPTWRGGK